MPYKLETEDVLRDRLDDRRCPSCGGDAAVETPYKEVFNSRYFERTCMGCGFTWDEVFDLNRFLLYPDFDPDGDYGDAIRIEQDAKHAQLIAAAPELLEALTGMVGEMERMGIDDTPGDTFTDLRNRVDEARAAIAKAQGGEA